VAKWLLLLLAVALLVGLSTTGVLASVRDAPRRVEGLVGNSGGGTGEQSRAQLSQFEFNALSAGTTTRRLRGLVGDPQTRQTVDVEGVGVECWYYGVARASGAYQLCFQNGRLRTKTRFNAWPGVPA